MISKLLHRLFISRNADTNKIDVDDQPDSTTDSVAVKANNLVKHYGDTVAVDGVTLSIPVGGVYGLLGPNGAGKTTTIRILATLLEPESGSATILGHDVVTDAVEVRKRVSLTGQFASVDEDLTGEENLILLTRLLGYSRSEARRRTNDLLEAFGLMDARDRQVKTYSGGMRRRLDIAASIVVTPEILFLDEPTTGLDPRNRNQVWDIIRSLVANGTTVLLTTQYLDEADQLADRIAVIDEGKIVAEGTPGELKAAIGTGILSVRVGDSSQRMLAHNILATTFDGQIELKSDPRALSVRIDDENRAIRAYESLLENGIQVSEFSLGQPSLDEVFLALTDHTNQSESRLINESYLTSNNHTNSNGEKS